MKNIFSRMAAVALTMWLGFAAGTAKADIAWTLSPDANTLASSVTVLNGLAQFGAPVSAAQPAGIFGAGFTTFGTSFSMNFDADLKTWDSYNAPVGSGTGWYDAFIVTVNTSDFYWNLPQSDPMPASASTFVWGGTNFADGILEGYKTAIGSSDNISLTSMFPTTFWVSLVLDTKTTPFTDATLPSYGSFHVSVVPEPETYAMLLIGLALLGFTARRRNLNS